MSDLSEDFIGDMNIEIVNVEIHRADSPHRESPVKKYI